MNKLLVLFSAIGVLIFTQCQSTKKAHEETVTEEKQKVEMISNPFVEGFFADPSVVVEDGVFYVYATVDPWGADSLALFTSTDFKNWTESRLNWPTKEQCQSPTSNDSRVWAPSVIKGLDGKFHMFVSVGSEVYAGISDHPAGPWKNVKEDNSPLIASQKPEGIHTIDAEAFIDDDGRAYLYWGSGWNWENGHLLVVTMNESMTEITSEMQDITPDNYFEAPYMMKKNGRYFMMYSNGKCINETYEVRVSEAETPFGPFTEIATSPVLTTTSDSVTRGPGHHTVMTYGGQDYILYHRINDNTDGLLRELCIDSLNFDKNGNMRTVITRGGVADFVK